MEKILKDRFAIAVFVLPALVFYLLVFLVPIVWSVVYSFYDGSPISGFKFVGVSNYFKLFDDNGFKASLWFSLKYAVVVSLGQVGLGLLMALIYTFYLDRASALVRTIVFIPVILPTVAVSEMFIKIFETSPQYGLVNALFASLHLDAWVGPWLAHANSAFWVIAIMDIWRAIGFYAILIYAGLIEIPAELIEAAKIDGADGAKLVRHIVLPLLVPVILSSLIFSLNSTLKVFDSILALTDGGPGTSTQPLTLFVFKTAFNYNEYGYGSAVAVVLTLLCLLATVLVLQMARRDPQKGGIGQ